MITTITPTLAIITSFPQLLLAIFVLLLLFGARKLPGLARGVGQAIREFSKAKNGTGDAEQKPPIANKSDTGDRA
jgi:sec-independent protein translocase protein TatA